MMNGRHDRVRLLVSVADAAEAAAALAGGADVIDAKDPRTGALGPVSGAVLRQIQAAVSGTRPLSAALGDAADEGAIARAVAAAAAGGATFVKIGFAGASGPLRIAALTAAAVRAATGTSAAVVVVAYADTVRAGGLAPSALAELAARAGASGLLVDTADKTGPGLRQLAPPATLAAWVADAHAAGLVVALAGRLSAEDLPFVRDAGADIAGVRGAACDGGRTGRVTADRVSCLLALLRATGGGLDRTLEPPGRV